MQIVQLVGYNRIYKNTKEEIVEQESFSLNRKELLKRILFVQNGLGFCHMKLYKKESIGKVKFNENLKVGEDALFNIEITKNINKFYMLNKNLYNYVFNNESVVRKYDENYVVKYLEAMKVTMRYINEQYKNDEEIIKNLSNYIAYHVLLIIVNYCVNPKRQLKVKEQLQSIKHVCNINEFKNAIEESDYNGISITRKVTLFAIKHKLYFLTSIIGNIRQFQFAKSKQ